MTSELFNINFVKYNPRLSESLGRGGAMFVNALQFLLNNQAFGKHHDGKKWVYNTMEQWGKSLKYSTRQIERIVSTLKKKQIILVKKLSHSKGNSTNYYTLNTLMLDALENVKEDTHLVNKKELNQNKNKELHITSLNNNDKMSLGSRQNGKLYTKKTNKEINNTKSEHTEEPKQKNQQVSQVSILKSIVKNSKLNISSSPKTTTAQDMLAIWNQSIGKNPVVLSKQLAPLLVAAYKNKFKSDLEQWKRYCKMVASSSYLMSNTFHLCLLWALKYSTIDRIHNFELGVTPIMTSTYTKEMALTHINGVNEPRTCKDARLKLLQIYGEKTYKDWFEPLHFGIIDNQICFQAKNDFMNDYVKNKFGQFISKLT